MEDKRLIQIMDSSSELKDGRYQLPLPFEKNGIKMPNNRHLTEQRALSLKRKHKRTESFHQEYKAFMEGVISSGHAGLVPQDQLNLENGRQWYIPHYGVYHPRKGNLRVVFDYSGSY